ncbi:MAG: efflux RND transporter permease subunit [Bacteroidales bacterium]|nr:efflux RND transporter permease subunit [Bacteroidales bacterium]
MSEKNAHKGIPPFTVVLVMAALSLVGLACLPRINVQYTPTAAGQGITVSYSLPDASAPVMEAEATSLIEGVLSGIRGVTDISSVSRKGSGSVTVTFRKGVDMEAARFEVASAVRNVWPSLPRGLTYPSIRFSSGGGGRSAVSYTLKGPLPSQEIERYAREYLLTPLSTLPDVDGVSLSGATPWHWVVTFDAGKAASTGVSAEEIARAISGALSEDVLGMTVTDDGQMAVKLSGASGQDLGAIPVKRVGGQILYLRDLATWRYEETLPSHYYRVNGLNTITLSVTTTEKANLLSAVTSVKEEMARLQEAFPAEITAQIAYDASSYIRDELRKIYLRTGLCVLLLLLFVLATSRSWRYLLIIASTLAVNILSALSLYALVGLQVHIYTLAGITVSLGIIIDTTIVMADHYGYWKDRQAFPALFAATATTLGALLMVLLLPESERTNLTDFIWVIVINLSLSLVMAYLFVPSLIDLMPVNQGVARSRPGRRQVLRNRRYARYIDWGVRHRWVYLLVFAAAFSYPCYRFYQSLDRSNFYRQPQRKQLYIRAGMLEGCTVNQLNEVVRSMENYLAGFEEIEVFTTSVRSYDDAAIVVEFKPEYEKTAFPLQLKSQVTAMAINFGGANWQVYGIDQNGFNNNIVSTYKAHRISLKGYNYEELLEYAQVLMRRISSNRRVQEPEIWSPGWGGRPGMEFNLDYDFETLTAAGVNPYHYYSALSSRLYDQRVGTILQDGEAVEMVLRSSDRDRYDLWHVLHEPVAVDSLKVALASVGNIVKQRSGLEIYKSNQSYQVDVCFDFIGSYALAKKLIDASVDYMNGEVLPVGFKAEYLQGGWFQQNKERYLWLIFLIVGVIFVMLSMTFESVKLPLAVIFMIPVSFIGLFLVFGWSRLSFDQGGFAAFVMLCGIVVNAGIYLITSWQRFGGPSASRREIRIRRYVKAFNHKIVPILLTVVSTALGLAPFLSDGPEEVFWFDFAAGTIGGLLFSLIALVLFLPVFAVKRKESRETSLRA